MFDRNYGNFYYLPNTGVEPKRNIEQYFAAQRPGSNQRQVKSINFMSPEMHEKYMLEMVLCDKRPRGRSNAECYCLYQNVFRMVFSDLAGIMGKCPLPSKI